MREYRRLFIDRSRFKSLIRRNPKLEIVGSEKHYLRRVLRINTGELVLIVDGYGNSWQTILMEDDSLMFKSNLDSPFQVEFRKSPLICLAVSVPKRGFEEILRMTCEIGVDIIQPLSSERNSNFAFYKSDRWNTILKDSVELSERLWKPELLKVVDYKDLIKSKPINSYRALAVTRLDSLIDINSSLLALDRDISQIWIFIGPEGGWTDSELQIAKDHKFDFVHLGGSILRTSTACVSAVQSIESWRRITFQA
mgnify:CR=1 FL=1